MQDKYFGELIKKYGDRYALISEISRLNVILNLPKGTEHFMSDIHGEYEAFAHIRRNASGVIRKKINALFSDRLSQSECASLAALIYYPKEKLELLREAGEVSDVWYRDTMIRLVELCRLVSDKYTRKKTEDILYDNAPGYAELIDELIGTHHEMLLREESSENIFKAIIRLDAAESFIIALCDSIRALVIDRWHIVGDIYDRGARADIVMDELMGARSIDIEWGNHDALWLGAAAGSRAAIAAVLNNSITYGNLELIEVGYGISLRPLAQFAEAYYKECDVSAFMPRVKMIGDMAYADEALIARMHKAISILQFKLEGELIMRNPDFDMNDRLLLDKIDRERGTVRIVGKDYPLLDCDFPTVDQANPYALTYEEKRLIEYLENAFKRSEKLRRHAAFLFEVGGMYKVYNRNLMFHGCIPLDDDGGFKKFAIADGKSGKAFMDFCDSMARQGFFAREGTAERLRGQDFLWFLWCGKDSPLCARKKIATFERLLVDDTSCREEPKNYYYHVWNDESLAKRILAEFSLPDTSHIINGHIPVKRGENPIKSGGRVIVIDGGFCSAFKSTTGISGYTLIYNAEGMRLSAHEAFSGKENAIKTNADIISETVIFEEKNKKIRIRETDQGAEIREKITDLMMLLEKIERGEIKEKTK